MLITAKKKKYKNKHPKRPRCAPASPCPWSSVSRNDGEQKWPPSAAPRLSSPSIQCASAIFPNKSFNHWPGRWNRTDGAQRCCVPAQLDTTTAAAHKEPEHEGKVPWWQPAACPAWHSELESRAPTSSLSLSHLTFTFYAFLVYFFKTAI